MVGLLRMNVEVSFATWKPRSDARSNGEDSQGPLPYLFTVGVVRVCYIVRLVILSVCGNKRGSKTGSVRTKNHEEQIKRRDQVSMNIHHLCICDLRLHRF